ncbi:MAG TPA: hypothetical protein VN719_06395 [Gemmatimonadales bacterium]|nr:hypothetical protein [Gemmatimonadales bacterium]
MGNLAHFDLTALIERHGLHHFVETGTGQGQGLLHAARFNFRTLRSCDIEPSLAHTVSRHIASDSRISVVTEQSPVFLRWACRLLPRDEPILFWLDAHFPGADYGIRGYGGEPDEGTRLPLPQELALIANLRPEGRDVILIDDLRIWLDAPFASGNLPADVRPFCPRKRDASFFAEKLGATHDVSFDYANEGYVTALPKEKVLAC